MQTANTRAPARRRQRPRSTAGRSGSGCTTTFATRSSSGRLPPGTELSEVALAESLGVSRGPDPRGARPAGRRGSRHDPAAPRRRRARALSSDEFIEAYQVREALETMAVRLAVPKLTGRGRAPRWSARSTRCRDCGDAGRRAGVLRGEHRVPPRLLRRGRQPDAGRTSTGSCEGRSTGTGCARSSCAATCGARSPSTRRSSARRRPATSSGPCISCPSTSACRRSGCSSRTTEPATGGRRRERRASSSESTSTTGSR